MLEYSNKDHICYFYCTNLKTGLAASWSNIFLGTAQMLMYEKTLYDSYNNM